MSLLKAFTLRLDTKFKDIKIAGDVVFVQGDEKTGYLNIALFEGSQILDITDADSASIVFKKADGNITVSETTDIPARLIITDATNGRLSYQMGTDDISFPGQVIGTISLFGSAGERLSTSEFEFTVNEYLDSDGEATTSVSVGSFNQRITDLETKMATVPEDTIQEIADINLELDDIDLELDGINDDILNIETDVDDNKTRSETNETAIDNSKTSSTYGAFADMVTRLNNTDTLVKVIEDNMRTKLSGEIELENSTDIISVSDVGEFSGVVDVEIDGGSIVQSVKNPNFVDTSEWSAQFSSNLSSNNILSNTANGTNVDGRLTQNLVEPNVKMFIYAKVRVTNSDAQLIGIRQQINSIFTDISSQSNPIQNQWYELYATINTGTITDDLFILRHNYIDVSTSLNKVMEVDGNAGVFAIKLEGDDLTLTADELKDKYTSNGYLPYGINNVKSPILTRRGDNKNVAITTVSALDANGEKVVNPNRLSTEFDTVFNNQQYTISNDKGYTFKIYFFDSAKNYISDVSTATFTTPSNARYIKYMTTIDGQNDLSVKVMLNEGAVALTYVTPDKTEILTTDLELRGVPSGSKDRLLVVDSKKTVERNVLEHTLIGTEVTAISNGTFMQILTIPMTPFTGHKTQADAVAEGSFLIAEFTKEIATVVNLDLAANPYAYSTDATNLYLSVPLATYATLGDAQTGLDGTVINYELETKQTIEEPDFESSGFDVDGLLLSLDGQVNTFDISSQSFNQYTKLAYDRNISTALNDVIKAYNESRSLIDSIFEILFDLDSRVTILEP